MKADDKRVIVGRTRDGPAVAGNAGVRNAEAGSAEVESVGAAGAERAEKAALRWGNICKVWDLDVMSIGGYGYGECGDKGEGQEKQKKGYAQETDSRAEDG